MNVLAKALPLLAPLLLLLPAPARGKELLFARYPAPSPRGRRLAFVYQGDLWVAPMEGGPARRITVHQGYDAGPVWSPDGRRLAFHARRHGNWDVYVVDLEEGSVRRLTHHAARDQVAAFTADGRRVLFTSYRPVRAFVRPLLYSVSLDGGMPRRESGAAMLDPCPGPDGRTFVFVRGRAPWHRKGYRGSAECRLWIGRPGTGRYGLLTEGPGNRRWPQWSPDGSALYYASDEGGRRLNLRRMDLRTRQSRALTDFRDWGVRFPRLSADGSTLAFARGPHLYRLGTADGSVRRLALRAPVDARTDLEPFRTFASGASDLALSPSTDDLAFTVRGDVFALERPPADPSGGPPVSRRARRLTRHAARDRGAAFSPDGATVVFCSDRNGDYDLYRVRSAGEEKRLSRTLKTETGLLVRTPLDEEDPSFSPDGRRLAFRRGRGALVVLDLASGEETCVYEGWNLSSFAWSPDGRWFAVAKSDEEYNSDIFLLRSDGSGEPVNVSRHPDTDRSPVWFPNGRGLAFVSERNRDDEDIWMVFLRRQDFEAPEEERWRAWTAEPPKDGTPPEVVVDWEDLPLRLVQLTSLPGDEYGAAVSPDSRTVLFFAESGGRRGVWTVSWNGRDLRPLSEGVSARGPLHGGAGGGELFYLDRSGRVEALSLRGGRRRPVPFEAALRVDVLAERRQMFGEAWRLLDRHFYDPGFHGADWEACRERYEPLAMAASTDEDFASAVRMMLGELNASHLGFSTPSRDEDPDETGCLGVFFDPSHEGPGLRVARVVERGPACREESLLRPGDVVRRVSGEEVGAESNLHRLLNHTAGRKVLLEVLTAEGTVEKVIRPWSEGELRQGLYEAFVERNRRAVARSSGGRLAYLHVRGMNWSSFERFERELYSAAHGREGLLLDVRNNGGGWTADMLLTVLSVRPHAVTRSRGSGRGYPQGRRVFYAWTRPTAVLCNEASFSNAEIFSHAFQTLGLGPLVGRPTFGGVISTGATRLLDGSRLRLPTRGWWVYPDGPDMELNGAVPDHDVPLGPADEEAGRDPQLARGVAVLLERLRGE